LAGGIAHEFNNLLMGIQGYTSLMLLKAIEGQVVSAADLTGQLLGYARGGRYEINTTNMNELIHNTASIFGGKKRESTSIRP
jgi:signal transduction histidine kinase